MERLLVEPDLRALMGRRAIEHARGASWESLLAELSGEAVDEPAALAYAEEVAAEGWGELLASA